MARNAHTDRESERKRRNVEGNGTTSLNHRTFPRGLEIRHGKIKWKLSKYNMFYPSVTLAARCVASLSLRRVVAHCVASLSLRQVVAHRVASLSLCRVVS